MAMYIRKVLDNRAARLLLAAIGITLFLSGCDAGYSSYDTFLN